MTTIWVVKRSFWRLSAPISISIGECKDLETLTLLIQNHPDLAIPKTSCITLVHEKQSHVESLADTYNETNPLVVKVDMNVNTKILLLFGVLIAVNVVVWVSSVLSYLAQSPSALPLLVVAYTLGLRHGLDADHIAAIDNTTRRFLANGETPITLGLFFSFGHSTIVIVATILVAIVANTVAIDNYNQFSSIIGPSISAAFLLLIGIVNCFAIWSTIHNLRTVHETTEKQKTDISGGLFSSMFGDRLFKLVDRPWKMYIIGFLFGLGFDTATEIALLSVVVIQSSDGISWLVLFLSLLFTCGMTLVDSIDGVLMLKIYGWDAVSPIQKLIFSLVITSMSVIFALGIALVQIFGIFQAQYNLEGPFWDFIANTSDSFEFIGVFMVGSFVASFLVAYLVWKVSIHRNETVNRKDELKQQNDVVVQIPRLN